MPDEEVGDGGGLLHGDQVRGAGYDREAGVRYAGDQGAGLGGAGDLVVGPTRTRVGTPIRPSSDRMSKAASASHAAM